MKSFALLFLISILSLSSCSHQSSKVDIRHAYIKKQDKIGNEDYLTGLGYLQDNKADLGKKHFNKSCLLGFVSSCQAIANLDQAENVLKKSFGYRLSVVQGATDESSTQINAVVPKSFKAYPVIWSEGKLISQKNYEYSYAQRVHSDFIVLNVKVRNIKKHQNYRIEFLTENSTYLDARTFKAFDNSKKSLKVLVTSCASDEWNKLQAKVWPEALSHNADVIFMIGDNVYADRVAGKGIKEGVDEAILWRRNVEHRNMLQVYFSKHLTPTYAVWDDHDYGKNNGDRYFTHKIDSQLVFHSFWSQEDNTLLERSFGVSFKLKLRGQNIYFLDNRSFRDPVEDKLGGHFGDKQEQWLFKNLKSNKKRNWIISGDQFFGEHHPFESFEGTHKKRFESFLGNIKKVQGEVLFISGDRHLTELMKVDKSEVGVDTVEFTSSGVHSKYYPGTLKKFPSKRMISGAEGLNYGLISTTTKPNEAWRLNIKSLSLNKKVLFDKDVEIK